MYHIVYLTTNLVNNKIYIGIHSTYNLEDGYLGSSSNLKQAIKKYGINNFSRIIIHYCLSREELYQWEKQIVDKSFISRTDTYNMKEGGKGGLPSFKHSIYTKNKQSISKSKTKKIQCEYCLTLIDPQNYAQLHGKYCKSNPNREERTISKQLCIYCNKEYGHIIYNIYHGKYCKANPNREERVLPRKTCEYCNITTDSRNYSRFHGLRCKQNPNRIEFPKKTCEYCNREIDSKNYTRYHGKKCKHYLLNPTASQ